MFFSKRKKEEAATPRPMITGSITIADAVWTVREEKRGGEQSQLLVLQRSDNPDDEMRIRPLPGCSAATLDDVESLAADPTYRFFNDDGGRRWEAGIVVSEEPGSSPEYLVKFISRMDVHEVSYPFPTGLGLRTDAELRELLVAGITGG